MRVLVSPTAFKGTLTPVHACRIITATIKKHRPAWSIVECPVADGGDGTLEVLSSVLKARRKKTRVHGPLGKKVTAEWAITGTTALIEMARASGLALVKGKNRVMHATTYGTGELIRAAINAGCRQIVIGVGGTATADGGAGALRALGLIYTDAKGKVLSGSPADLETLENVDWKNLDARLRRTKIFVVCDVTNPLLGARGSARTFGPQKGATPAQVRKIECALRHWSGFAKFQTRRRSGSGAAGALAFGLSAFLGAKLVEGSPFIFKMLKWRAKARRADAIIAGEGQIDGTSFSGKTIGEMTKGRLRARIFLICGRNRVNARRLRAKNIPAVVEMGARGLRAPKASLEAAAKTLLSKIR